MRTTWHAVVACFAVLLTLGVPGRAQSASGPAQSASGPAQSPGPVSPAEGRWWGLLTLGERTQRVSLELKRDGSGGWGGYIDVLRTNDRRVRLVGVVSSGSELSFAFRLSGDREFAFEGVIDGYVLDGNVEGGGVAGRLRAEREPPRKPRIQEPVGGVPYVVREVVIEAEGVRLPGTLTLPANVGEEGVPGVVLVSAPNGRGRDQDAAGHKPYLVLADRLTRAGVAVLRYDDRTMYTAGLQDVRQVVEDAEAALRTLAAVPGVREDAVGVLAHGEGALVSMAMLARERALPKYAVMLSAPGLRGIDLKPRQISKLMVANALPPAFAAQYLVREMAAQQAVLDGDPAAVRRAVIAVLALRSGDQREEVLDGEERFGTQADFEVPRYDSVWNRYYLGTDPSELLSKVRVPVLVLHGGKDQIHDPEDNLAAIDGALRLSSSPGYEIEVFPAGNHQLQTAQTGAMSEVVGIEETMSEALMRRIAEWIAATVRRR